MSTRMGLAGRTLRFRVLHATLFSVVFFGLDVLKAGWPPSHWSGLLAGPLFFCLSLMTDTIWQWYRDA